MKSKDVVSLYHEGYSRKEIAGILGMTEMQVKDLIRVCRVEGLLVASTAKMARIVRRLTSPGHERYRYLLMRRRMYREKAEGRVDAR